MGNATPRDVVIVPHTHWDREWYAGFQTFRLKLIDLLDDLLPRLESDPSYAHFLLDGQMAVVDDYLALRPEAEPALRRLAASGRLAIGPWYILMDEFLVSGETMVRDLQMGFERAAAFSGAMEVGYLPDMFGHVAQMPQLLQQFGLDHAVVWRGVPAAVSRTGFWWEAPDGSSVRAEYLPEGYGNGAALPDDAKDLVAMVDRFEQAYGDMLIGPILWMQGTDHQSPRPWLGRVVAEANEIQDRYRLRVAGLAEYVASAPVDDLPRWRGELRSGSRANLLMGVGSNRVDVKQACAIAERMLERVAEPLAALHLPAQRWPHAQLAEAWRLVVRNCAHDSVCACSIDEVCDAVLHRYAEARQIADGLAERAVTEIADRAAAGPARAVVVNPSSRPRSDLVEVRIPGEGDIAGLQLLRRSPGETATAGLTRAMLVTMAREVLDAWRDIAAAEVTVDDGVMTVTVTRDPDLPLRPYGGSLFTDAKRIAREDPAGPARFVLRRPPLRTYLARVTDLPAYGWRTFEPEPLDVDPVVAGEGGSSASLSNGLVTLTVDASNGPAGGTFAIGDLGGLGRLVDGGDVGDTYNWCPPAHDRIIDTPEWSHVAVTERGPLRGRLELTSGYRIPTKAEGGERVGEELLEVTTTLELRAGERLLRVSVALDHNIRDHRLRAWFPLPHPTTTSRAECAFATVERGLEAEGGPTELALPTFPSRRFVQAGGLTILHEGLLEYELTDIEGGEAHSLALTLLRATGMLSQGPMTTRPLPAGPLLRVEGAQVQGHHELRYAMAVGDDVDPWSLAEVAFTPLQLGRVRGNRPDDAPSAGGGLEVSGAEVSALFRQAGKVTVRVFNPTDTATAVRLPGRTGWLVDLRGAALEPFEGEFDLAPWRIATAVLDEA